MEVVNHNNSITLLLIDIQNDFHPPHGSLAVPGADIDVERTVSFIKQHVKYINRIIVTMDTHPKLHIAHSLFWYNPITNEYPKPFTIITTNDIIEKKWLPRSNMYIPRNDYDPNILDTDDTKKSIIFQKKNNKEDDNNEEDTIEINIIEYCIEYTKRLEKSGKFQLCIWPEHCLMGSIGHNIVSILQETLYEWTTITGRNVEYIVKGQNMLTEMYSVISAEIPITLSTCLNQSLLQSLYNSNKLVIAGQALSHCVNYTIRDIVTNSNNNTDDDESNTHSLRNEQIYLLTDCCSSVPGFEQNSIELLYDMKQVGVQCIKSIDLQL